MYFLISYIIDIFLAVDSKNIYSKIKRAKLVNEVIYREAIH